MLKTGCNANLLLLVDPCRGIFVAAMPQPIKSKKRNSRQTGVRIYVDQLQALQSLAEGKYRGRVTIADLIREAVDRFLDKEDPDWFKG